MSFTGARNGKLIVFEGIDGTGKSTHISHLARHLTDRGLEVVQSFEPTHGQWGKLLRQSALTGRMTSEQEIELFLKDRREHVQRLIAPALQRGAWVLLDRYYFSMMAYQGARGANVHEIRQQNESFAPVPDLVIWLDIPVHVALGRIGARGKTDAFETSSGLTACRQIFAAVREPWFLRIDADAPQPIVIDRVRQALQPYLPV